MTKISNQIVYIPDIEINGLDYFIGTDYDQNKKTVNFRVEDLGGHYNITNGVRNFEYIFYEHTNISPTPTDGYFYANDNETDPNNINYFIFSKKTARDKDVTQFFQSIISDNPFDLIIAQKTGINTIFFFRIDEIIENANYFRLNVSEVFFPENNSLEYRLSHAVFNLKSSGDINTIESLTSDNGSITITPNGKNRNIEVSQATESKLGGGKIVDQSTIEDSSSTNDTDIVTPKKFWLGWVKGLTLESFFTSVRNTVLTGFSLAYTRITASDSILSAFEKTQGQIDDLLSTTVSSFSHNINAGDNTKFDFVVSGVIRNPTSGLITTVINQIFTAQSVTHNSNGVTYFGLKEDLTITQQSTRFTTEQKYNHLCEWVVIYNPSTFVIITFNDYPNTSKQLGQQLHNYMKNSGVRNLGNNQYTNFGSTILNIYKPIGGIVEGVGWGNLDTDNPNEKNMPAIVTADTFNIRISIGDYLTGQTVIDPTIYEPNGDGTVNTVPNPNDVTVYRIAFFNSNLTRVQLGQTLYPGIDEAIARTVAKSDAYITESNISDNGLTITYLAIQKNCTSWSQTTRYRFFPAPQSGNASSATFVTFNSIYNIVSAPQQTITDTKGEMQYDSQRASSSSKVMSWLFGGIEKANVNGLGTFNSQSLTESTPLASDSNKNIISATDSIWGSFINNLTSKSTPVDADMIGLMDSSDGNKEKKLSWLNIKSTLKTYFDTLYAPSTIKKSEVFVSSRDWTTTTLDRAYYISFNNQAIEFNPVGTNNTISGALIGRNIGMFVAPYNCKIINVQLVTFNTGNYTGILGIGSGTLVNSALGTDMNNKITHLNQSITNSLGFVVNSFSFTISGGSTITKGDSVCPILMFSAQAQAAKNGVIIQIEIQEV